MYEHLYLKFYRIYFIHIYFKCHISNKITTTTKGEYMIQIPKLLHIHTMRITPMIIMEGDIINHKLIREEADMIREEADFRIIRRRKAINITSLACLTSNGIDVVNLETVEDAQLTSVLQRRNQDLIGFDLMIV